MDKKHIVIISHNDILGGAAIVSYRLMQALRDLGHDVKMLVFNKYGDDPDVICMAGHAVRTASFLTERFDIFMHNGRSRENLFKVSTGKTGLPLLRNKYIKRADAILLNWVNQATVSLRQIEKLSAKGKRIVWTMHDMWCFTGICHHSFGCKRYEQECGRCPFLGIDAGDNDLSHRVWKHKQSVYEHSNIQFVAVSSWVKERALESSLLAGRDIKVIHNAFPADEFSCTPTSRSLVLKLRNFKHVISFGAANLNDHVKGIEFAIDALNIFSENYPEQAAGSVAVFFGEVRDSSVFERLRFPYIITGSLSDLEAIQHIYSLSTVVLSTSRYECLSGTLIEGMACGATPVTFGEGGMTDFIEHKKNGYIAKYLDPRDIAAGISWAFNAAIPRQELHNQIAEKFDARKIALQYLELINKPTES